MRKMDYIRKHFNKIMKKGDGHDIYYIKLPDAFMRKGDYEVGCEPASGIDGRLIGVAVVHYYWDPEDEMDRTWVETFVVDPAHQIKIKKGERW